MDVATIHVRLSFHLSNLLTMGYKMNDKKIEKETATHIDLPAIRPYINKVRVRATPGIMSEKLTMFSFTNIRTIVRWLIDIIKKPPG
ncbi:hypothetical protein GXP67_00665 [Rhodocytophaga rosea]|uniref:Uncharacterized protein n=1 Tax=Rhodocytophaga rosea TaxID=2704465 RepID=A0A6C0GBL3_9BACT|nr:hypothetical protein [Rhodocytophaga rosea]QHT65287.1 hypothetical protein GXP67_00665 [Rhodocytophaga rosea]